MMVVKPTPREFPFVVSSWIVRERCDEERIRDWFYPSQSKAWDLENVRSRSRGKIGLGLLHVIGNDVEIDLVSNVPKSHES
jgi:hypothetical protein